MGNFFFSKLKALWDQGLRGRGSKMIKYEREQEKLTGQTAKPCSIGLVTYTATNNPESTVSKRAEKDNKGYEFTRMVVTTTVRGATRTNKDERAQNTRTAINDIRERRSQKETIS